MNILKHFNKRTRNFPVIFPFPIICIFFLYWELLPDAGGNEECSRLLGLGIDLEEDFGMEFKPQWIRKDFNLYCNIFRYKASWNEYKNLESFLISRGWEVREGTLGEERMQTARVAWLFDLQDKTFIIIGGPFIEGKGRSKALEIVYDKDRALLYFELEYF